MPPKKFHDASVDSLASGSLLYDRGDIIEAECYDDSRDAQGFGVYRVREVVSTNATCFVSHQ